MIKSLRKNCIGYFQVNPEAFHRRRKADVVLKTENPVFKSSDFVSTSTFSAVRSVTLRIDFKTVHTVLSQTFKRKICFEYATLDTCMTLVKTINIAVWLDLWL